MFLLVFQLCADGKTLLDTLQTPVSSGSHNSLTAKADYTDGASHVLDVVHEVRSYRTHVSDHMQKLNEGFLHTNGVFCVIVLVMTIDAQWEMGDGGCRVGEYEPALLPPCPTIRVLSYSN